MLTISVYPSHPSASCGVQLSVLIAQQTFQVGVDLSQCLIQVLPRVLPFWQPGRSYVPTYSMNGDYVLLAFDVRRVN